jgi:hypothetical protein
MNRLNHLAGLLAGAAAIAVSTPIMAQDSYLQIATGADYSSGDYGETVDTKMLALPVTVKYQGGDFFVSAQTSYLRVEGPDNLVPGDGGVTPGGPSTGVSTRKGMGDTILSAGYSFGLTDRTYFDVVGKVKLPTASESKFLGTGTTDYTAQGELLQVFGEVSAAVRGGRRFNGSSTLFPLRDVWQAGAGLYYQTGPVTLGLDYDWRDNSLASSEDRSEATASLTYRITPAIRLQGYGYTGFAEGSPDVGGGAQLLYRFGM